MRPSTQRFFVRSNNLEARYGGIDLSGRIKGIILNILVPGSGFMAQSRWGWGFLYLILALVLLLPTIGIGYLAIGLISAFHAGILGDAKHELSKKDIERIAVASAVAQKKMAEIDVPVITEELVKK